jgi:hypothetical protein
MTMVSLAVISFVILLLLMTGLAIYDLDRHDDVEER